MKAGSEFHSVPTKVELYVYHLKMEIRDFLSCMIENRKKNAFEGGKKWTLFYRSSQREKEGH